jgi:hypothetical protein
MAFLGSLQHWALGLFGVPLPVVFGAFAGTCYGLTFNKTTTALRLGASMLVTTILAAVAAPGFMGWLSDSPPVAALAGAGAALGFVLQFGAPWLAENRQSILDRLGNKYLGPR